MNTNRKPAGSIGVDGRGTGGRWDIAPPKDKGTLQDWDLSDSPLTIRAMTKAHSMMDILERSFSLECGRVGDRTWIKGTLISRVNCPRCGGLLDVDVLKDSELHDAICLDCGRSVDVVSERRRLARSGHDQDIAEAIDYVVADLRKDFLQESTSGDQADIALRMTGAESVLEYWIQELGFNPGCVSSLPIEFLENGSRPATNEVTIVIDPDSLDVKLSAMRIPLADRDYLDIQEAECELPLEALKELENALYGYRAYRGSALGERQLVRERISLSIKWAELRDKERRIWNEG